MTTDLVGIHPSPPCVVARCRSVQTRSSAVCRRNRRRSLSSLHPACGMVSGCPRQGRSPPARPPHRTKGRGCCRRRRRPRSRWPRRRRRGKTARRARGVSPHDAAVVGGEDREDARAAAAVVEDLDCHSLGGGGNAGTEGAFYAAVYGGDNDALAGDAEPLSDCIGWDVSDVLFDALDFRLRSSLDRTWQVI